MCDRAYCVDSTKCARSAKRKRDSAQPQSIDRAYSAESFVLICGLPGTAEFRAAPETLDLLAAPAIAPRRRFYDECLKVDGAQFSLGFMKPSSVWPFGNASSFGSPGAGGSLGFANSTAGVGYAYVTNRMGTVLTGDPRDVALRDALYSAVRRREVPAETIRFTSAL